MDTIFLKDCRFYGYHGVLAEEQVLGQIFVVDCELSLDLTAASQSDDLQETVHYGQIFDLIKRQVETQKYQLLERLAGAIIETLLADYPAVQKVKLTLKKENPPIAGHYAYVGITLERQR